MTTLADGRKFKKHPWWLRLFVKPYTWITLGETIYHPTNIDLSEPWQRVEQKAMIAHETQHIFQQDRVWAEYADKGWPDKLAARVATITWLWRYVSSKSWRLASEVEAIAAELMNTPPAQHNSVVKFYSDALAGDRYGHCARTASGAEGMIRARLAFMESGWEARR